MNFMPAAYRWDRKMSVSWVVWWNDALQKQAYCSYELFTLLEGSKKEVALHFTSVDPKELQIL